MGKEEKMGYLNARKEYDFVACSMICFTNSVEYPGSTGNSRLGNFLSESKAHLDELDLEKEGSYFWQA